MRAAVRGGIIGATAGCAWGIVGAMGLPEPWRTSTACLGVGISAALIVALVKSRAAQKSQTFRGSIYAASVAFEAIAIFAAVSLLRRFALPQFIVPAVGIIVGFHFIGLWKATDLSKFLWIAVAMCAVCAFSLLLPGGEDFGIGARQAVAGLGCAVVLWSSGAASLF
jgi:hypothetical protein